MQDNWQYVARVIIFNSQTTKEKDGKRPLNKNVQLLENDEQPASILWQVTNNLHLATKTRYWPPILEQFKHLTIINLQIETRSHELPATN